MPGNALHPIENVTCPLDGTKYFFKKFSVEDEEVDLLADAISANVTAIVHVHIEVVSAGIIAIKVNGQPSNVADGKSVQIATPWDRRMSFFNLSCIRTAGTDPVDIEVEYWSGEEN